MSGLRRLDNRWLPGAAAAAQRIARRWTRGAGAGSRILAGAVDEQPALAASIGTVLVAAVLIAAAGGDRNYDAAAPAVAPTSPPVLIATIGPAPGSSVASYLTRAAYDLRHFGTIAADRKTYAVVDLARSQTPAQVDETLAGMPVVRVYLRVPSRLPTDVRSVPLDNLRALPTGMANTAAIADATARSYASLLQGLHPKSATDREVKRRYAEQRRAAVVEAAALKQPARCACVFAVVVRADFDQLAALAHRNGVRVVDPAPPVIPLAGLTVRPLEPQIRTVVPRVGAPGG